MSHRSMSHRSMSRHSLPLTSVFITLVAALLWQVAPVSAQQFDSQAVILQYHHVSSTTPRSTSITADEFRMHMTFLRDNGFTVLPLPEILKGLKAGTPLPDKTAAITFDDAYVSVYTTAFPVLRELNWPFTVFIPSGLIGSNPRLYTTWEQLREMGKAGATLANHSVNHPYFLETQPREDATTRLARIEKEITDSEQKILAETGQSHKLHAYPYGEYDPTIEALIIKLGYIGLGQHSGPINASSSFTALPRFPFSGVYIPLKSFGPKALSLAFNVKIVEPSSPITSEKAPSTILDFDGNYRFDAMNCYVNDKPMKVTLIDAAAQTYKVTPPSQSTGRRFRYNCTAPGRDGRFYWFAVPWVNPALPDG
jgi:poly-beta-1,6-N-acetyl-D-glucosamine N-deacetylase